MGRLLVVRKLGRVLKVVGCRARPLSDGFYLGLSCGCPRPAQRQFAGYIGVRVPKRPWAALLLRARAKMAETKAILTLSNFSLKIAIGEDRSANAKALFQWSLRPFCCPETGKKYDNLYMYYITTVVCIWP